MISHFHLPLFLLLLPPLQGEAWRLGLSNDGLREKTSRGQQVLSSWQTAVITVSKLLCAARGRAVKFDRAGQRQISRACVFNYARCSSSNADTVHSQQSVRSSIRLSVFFISFRDDERQTFFFFPADACHTTVTQSSRLVLQVWRYTTPRRWNTFAPTSGRQREPRSACAAARPSPTSSSGVSPNRGPTATWRWPTTTAREPKCSPRPALWATSRCQPTRLGC